MDDLIIDVGVSTSITLDLTKVSFRNVSKVVLTIKNKAKYSEEAIVTRDFKTPEKHTITITPEESIKLKDGAVYDYIKVATDGNAYKITENGNVVLRRGVGDSIE